MVVIQLHRWGGENKDIQPATADGPESLVLLCDYCDCVWHGSDTVINVLECLIVWVYDYDFYDYGRLHHMI